MRKGQVVEGNITKCPNLAKMIDETGVDMHEAERLTEEAEDMEYRDRPDNFVKAGVQLLSPYAQIPPS